MWKGEEKFKGVVEVIKIERNGRGEIECWRGKRGE